MQIPVTVPCIMARRVRKFYHWFMMHSRERITAARVSYCYDYGVHVTVCYIPQKN